MIVLKDKYQIEEKISFSAGSKVFRGKDLEQGVTVAVKEMPVLSSNFRLEASSLKNLKHPGIVDFYDSFQEGNSFYIITDWVDGSPINSHSFSPVQWAEIFLKILEGIEYIHENGIIHRDLKPQNILVEKNGNSKIIDFGISIFQKDLKNEEEKLLGTLAYMSPEQTGYVKGGTDARSDIYSLGIIFYECIAGFNPFLGKDKSETIHKILSFQADAKALLDGPRWQGGLKEKIARLILKMLEKGPEKRYQSAKEIIWELKKILEVKFPLFDDNSSFFIRKEFLDELKSFLPDFLKKKHFALLFSGPYGSGRSEVLRQLGRELKEHCRIASLKMLHREDFALLKLIQEELSLSSFEELLTQKDFPVLIIEHIQRVDEASWNYLMKREKLLMIGSWDEDEGLGSVERFFPECKLHTLKPYNADEQKAYLNQVFEGKLRIHRELLTEITRFSQGNLDILNYLLKLFYQEKILSYQNGLWLIERRENIFSSVESDNILDYRYNKLDSNLRDFMLDLAVFGFSFQLENLRQMLAFFHVQEADLKDLLQKGVEESILEKNAGSFVFINKKNHDYFYEQLSSAQKNQKHLQIAKIIESLSIFKNRAASLFYHYFCSGQLEKAYQWGCTHLEELFPKYAYHEAIEVFEKLMELFEKMPQKSREDFVQFLELIQKMVDVYVFRGEYERIIFILKQQAEFLAGNAETERLISVYLNLGRLYSLKGELQVSRNWYIQAEKISEEIKRPEVLKKIYESISTNYLFRSRFHEAIHYYEKSRELPSRGGSSRKEIIFVGGAAFAYANLGKYHKARLAVERLEKFIELEENPHLKFLGIHYRILVLSHMGEVAELREEKLEATLARVREEGNHLLEYSLYFSLGYYYYRRKKLQKAHDYISKSIDLGRRVQVEVGILAPYLVLAEVEIQLKKNLSLKELFRNISVLARENKDLFSLQWLLRLRAMAESYLINAKPGRIDKNIHRAIQISRKLKLKSELARNYYYYSLICFNTAKFQKGYYLEQRSLELFSQLGMKWEEFEIKNMHLSQNIQTTQQFFGEKVKLEALSKITTLIARQKNSDELLKEMLKLSMELAGCNKGALFLEKDGNWIQADNWGMDNAFSIHPEVAQYLDFHMEPYIGSGSGQKSSLHLPIKFQDSLSGVLYLENDLISNIFVPEQIRTMTILSTVFGVLLENSRAYGALEEEKQNLESKVKERAQELYIRNRIIEKDLQAARKFHNNLMPKGFPNLKGMEGGFYYEPADEIGGDFYDYIPLSEHKMLFVIADSAGHGIQASLLTAMLKTGLLTYPDKRYRSISKLMRHLNQSLYGQIMDKYIVCLVGMVNTRTGTISVAGGGNILVHYRKNSGADWEKISFSGHMLGIIPNDMFRFDEKELSLEPGGELFFSTDGLIEQYFRDSKGKREIFGEPRLVEILNKKFSSKQLIQTIVESVKEFSGKEKFSDDITVMSFRRPE